MTTDKFLTDGASFWGRVEVVGRRTYHGKVTIESLGGAAFFRVETPQKPPGSREERGRCYRLDGESAAIWGNYRIHEGSVPGQTIFVGTGSIYQITPMPEETARKLHYEGVSGETLSVERVEQTALPVAVDFDAQSSDEDEGEDDDEEDNDAPVTVPAPDDCPF